MERSIRDIKGLDDATKIGTLAIDFGNSTTVIAFQEEATDIPELVNLPPISRSKGEVPSLVFQSKESCPSVLIGQQLLDYKLTKSEKLQICSDFKRWIGAQNPPLISRSNLSPEKAGELLIQQIWDQLPKELRIKRLVLTAPVDKYRSYKAWLYQVCRSIPVDEVALVDEPTAAALGAGLPSGSKLLVIDIGGSTIDLSLVALEGGEGKAEPVAQLLRFAGEDLEGKSKQTLRTARVLGKAGQRLGGRDFDKWIVHHLFPEQSFNESLLNTAEKLKCNLSNSRISATDVLKEIVDDNSIDTPLEFQLSRAQLEELFIERGLLKSMHKLLKQILRYGASNNCSLKDLEGVVLVGGGARIPLIRKWVKENIKPSPLLTPPPIEAVAKGALSLTPGVKIRDVLQRGASLRCWDKQSMQHIWHPLFVAGQPWPTTKGLELVISASKKNQVEIDLVIGEPSLQGMNEVIYIDGIPRIIEESTKSDVSKWSDPIKSFTISPPGKPGEDCLHLNFSINSSSYLEVEGIDIRTGERIEKQILGLVN